MVDALRAMRDEGARLVHAGHSGGAVLGRSVDASGAISQVGLGMNCNRMPHQGVPEEIARLVCKGC